LNLDIAQAHIHKTICNPSWSTKSIRPPEHHIHELKIEQIREYRVCADSDLRDYEEDHLIPLELGGNPTRRIFGRNPMTGQLVTAALTLRTESRAICTVRYATAL
jgi:hypothetical protein